MAKKVAGKTKELQNCSVCNRLVKDTHDYPTGEVRRIYRHGHTAICKVTRRMCPACHSKK